MFCGRNYLKITNGENSISFDPYDALALCVEQVRALRMEQGLIDLIPEQIGVEWAEEWSHKDTTGIKDYQAIEKKMDWTYSTPYKGTYSSGDAKPGPGIPLAMLSP